MQLPPDNRFSSTVRRYHDVLDAEYGAGEVQSMLSILAKEFLGWNRADMVLNREKSLSESELLKFHYALKDLMKGRPLQHVLGKTVFFGLEFAVNNSVLIPRPETEELVALILKRHAGEDLRILDIGTGSGCIPIALGKNRPGSEIHAIEISEEAIELARENAVQQEVSVIFHPINILEAGKDRFEDRYFDVIVSNPPYVLRGEAAQMHRNVLDHEPHLALFVEEDDPFLFYRKIIALSLSWLKPGGSLYFEINEHYGTQMLKLFSESQWSDVSLHNDMQGKARIVSAAKK